MGCLVEWPGSDEVSFPVSPSRIHSSLPFGAGGWKTHRPCSGDIMVKRDAVDLDLA